MLYRKAVDNDIMYRKTVDYDIIYRKAVGYNIFVQENFTMDYVQEIC